MLISIVIGSDDRRCEHIECSEKCFSLGGSPPAIIQSGGTQPDAFQFHDVADSKKE